MGYPYSSGDVLTAADLNQSSGLVFVKSVTVGSGVSSVTVTDAFDSRFTNYSVVITDIVSSAAAASFWIRLGSVASNHYGRAYGVKYDGTTTNLSANNTVWAPLGLISSAGDMGCTVQIYSPFSSSTRTKYSTQMHGDGSFVVGAGQRNVNFSMGQFTLLPGSGTLTGGTIRVYGYNNG